MNVKDAMSILNLSGNITPQITKMAYRRASAKYHPDRNPAGTEMMKAVNSAYDALKDFTGAAEETVDGAYGDELNSALNVVVDLPGVHVEVCGSWIWVTGDTKPHKEALGKNGAGFHYAGKKKAWYFRPSDWSSKSRGNWSLDRIRETHGSRVAKSYRKTLQSA